MKQGSRVNTLLVELMIVIFFFMLASTVMVRIFADARQCSLNAEARTDALLEAQNIAETIYAGLSPEEILSSYGFRAEKEGWTIEREHYWLRVESGVEMTLSGELYCSTITGGSGEEILFSFPCNRYKAEGSELR